MNIENRIEKLEDLQRVRDDALAERISWVLENPKEAAMRIGSKAVARVIELIEIAKARRAAADKQSNQQENKP